MKCPAKECGRAAAHVGSMVVCELGHRWAPTAVPLQCPKCGELAHHAQVKVDLVACVCCGKAWKLDQAAATDEVRAGIVQGDSMCDKVMLAVDGAARLAIDAGAREAVAGGSTTLTELVGRFKRGLISAGIPRR